LGFCVVGLVLAVDSVGFFVISDVTTVDSEVIAVALGGSILSHPAVVAAMAITMKPAASLSLFIGSPPGWSIFS
jgi:hypothetical protein